MPKDVFIGDSDEIRLVHDSGIVALIQPRTQRVVIEYYPGGVTESQQLFWRMTKISRGPTAKEVGLFRAAVEQAKIATSLMS